MNFTVHTNGNIFAKISKTVSRVIKTTVLIGIFATGVNAEFYEKDQHYIYKIRPYTEVLTDKQIVTFTAKLTHVALMSVMESMVENHVFPESILSIKDIDKLRKANQDVESLVVYLNKLVEEQRAEKGRFALPDLMPDALLVFGGKKLSLNLGASIGGSISLGVVLMPVFIEKYDLRSGQLADEYFSVKMSVVGWTNGDIGAAVGTPGSALRIGLGAIWDLNNSFVAPDQFWGAGLGASWSPIVLGAGVNAKVGVVSNWELPGWVDFMYMSAALELGTEISVGTPRANFTTFLSGSKIMALMESSQKKAFEAAIKDLGKKVDEALVEIKKRELEETHSEEEKEKKKEEAKLQSKEKP